MEEGRGLSAPPTPETGDPHTMEPRGSHGRRRQGLGGKPKELRPGGGEQRAWGWAGRNLSPDSDHFHFPEWETQTTASPPCPKLGVEDELYTLTLSPAAFLTPEDQGRNFLSPEAPCFQKCHRLPRLPRALWPLQH